MKALPLKTSAPEYNLISEASTTLSTTTTVLNNSKVEGRIDNRL